jgi:hypothetical protein
MPEVSWMKLSSRAKMVPNLIDSIPSWLIQCHTKAQEIATLRKEAQAFKVVRDALRSPLVDCNRDAAKVVFQKVGSRPVLYHSPDGSAGLQR